MVMPTGLGQPGGHSAAGGAPALPAALHNRAQRDNLSGIDRSPGHIPRRPHDCVAALLLRVRELTTP
ncbi:hypothetical protein NV64_02995 [Erwinia sp. B116]|nr:hypothetical protein ASF13_02410 [Erwinia sp. Leaf53]PLV62839.1 hypothetical protein NV64_02995 [Erwinia sp. B116]